MIQIFEAGFRHEPYEAVTQERCLHLSSNGMPRFGGIRWLRARLVGLRLRLTSHASRRLTLTATQIPNSAVASANH